MNLNLIILLLTNMQETYDICKEDLNQILIN
jgi:hypothetical protein